MSKRRFRLGRIRKLRGEFSGSSSLGWLLQACLIFLESRPFHTPLSLCRCHEGVPHKTGAQIFGHQHDDSRINANYIGVIPVLSGLNAFTNPYLLHAAG